MEQESTSDPPESRMVAPHRLLVFVWFLYLFSPQKIITFYVPGARPLSWIPELLLWVCAVKWVQYPNKRGYPAYTRFMLLLLFGTGVAFFIGNAGPARETLRQLYQYYLLCLITLTYCSTLESARPIFRLYFGYFLWFAVWGLISLKTAPLSAYENPGARPIVYWHPNFDNRDAFGPLMVAGLAYSIYYYQAAREIPKRGKKFWTALSIGLCSIGFVTSFGRGAFIGFVVTAGSIWLRSRRRIAALIWTATAIGAFAVLAPNLTSKYWASMQTITAEGTDSGTGGDRMGLWGVAWREFLWSPIVGVGTDNYGLATQIVVKESEGDVGHGYTKGRLWGRSVHSTPMTILSEYGLVGVVVTLLLVVDFYVTNRRIRARAALAIGSGLQASSTLSPEYVRAIALGLHGVFLTFCVSGVMYEIIYTPLYWTIITLNRLLYVASGAASVDTEQARAVEQQSLMVQ